MRERLIDEAVVQKFIITGVVTAVYCGLLITFMGVIGALGFNLFSLIDAALWFGLAYGVYRKSRTCAILLLVIHLGNRVDVYERTQDLSNVFGIFAIAIATAFVLAILGTFTFHAIKREKQHRKEQTQLTSCAPPTSDNR